MNVKRVKALVLSLAKRLKIKSKPKKTAPAKSALVMAMGFKVRPRKLAASHPLAKHYSHVAVGKGGGTLYKHRETGAFHSSAQAHRTASMNG
jgi:hypothetical protein